MDLGDKAVIHWFGRRGGTIENILDQDLTAIQSCAPKICVLVVGGNDLDQGLDPMRVACRLIGLAQVLRNRAGAQQIYILGIIPRPGPRYLTPVKFSEAADACNSHLNLLLGGDQDNKKAYPETYYWRLRRFMSSRMPIHNRDQVHLNDLGNKRLYHNIRHAILVQSMLAASLPAVVKEVMEATKTSSLEANKSAQGQAATNDQGNDQELQERNTTGTSIHQSAVDSAVQQQTVNVTAGKLRLPSLPLDLHLSADLKAKVIGNTYVKFGQLISKDTPEEDKMQLQVAHTPQVSNT